MLENFNSPTEQSTEGVREKIYGAMSRVMEKHPKSRHLVMGLATMMTVFSAPEIRNAAPEAGEKPQTMEQFLVQVQNPEVAGRIKFIDDKLHDFNAILPEQAGQIIYDNKWVVEHISHNKNNYDLDEEKGNGQFPEEEAGVFVSYGHCSSNSEAMSETNDHSDHNFHDSLATTCKLAKPKGGKIEAAGESLKMEGSSTLSKQDAIRDALENALTFYKGINISIDSQLKDNSTTINSDDQATAANNKDFVKFIVTTGGDAVASYRILEYREEKNEKMGYTDHIVKLEVVPGKFVPGPEEKPLSPEYGGSSNHAILN